MSDRTLVKALGELFDFSRSGNTKRKTNFHDNQPTKSCMPEVIQKLRGHPDYQDPCLENHLKMEAEDLTDAEKLLNRFFSTITDQLVEEKIKEKELERSKLATTYERGAKAINRVEDAARIQVKLLLRYVDRQTSSPRFIGKLASLLKMEYGPLHASLLINNEILLEWNSSSLVIPRLVDPDAIECMGPTLMSAAVPGIKQIQRELSRPFEEYDEMELIFDAVTQKSEVLQSLAKIVVQYNSHYYYHVIFRNCQNFVLDALAAIGCKDKAPQFSGSLKDYFTHLKRNGQVKETSFKTHEELDAYVRENHRKLTQENMEYLLAQYYIFHMQSIAKSNLHKEQTVQQAWNCGGDCMMNYLEAKVDEKLLMVHHFLHPPE